LESSVLPRDAHQDGKKFVPFYKTETSHTKVISWAKKLQQILDKVKPDNSDCMNGKREQGTKITSCITDTANWCGKLEIKLHA
jgi:hypothetical protein